MRDRGQDSRTLPGEQQYNTELDALLRDIKARQGLVRSLIEDTDSRPVPFIGSATANTRRLVEVFENWQAWAKL
jgi:hypothetical protein